MNGRSTERARRFRERQQEAGRKRITLYLDRDTQRRLDQLAGDKAQGRYLEMLVKTAIKREWSVLESRRKDTQAVVSNNPARLNSEDRLPQFPGRRRSLVGT